MLQPSQLYDLYRLSSHHRKYMNKTKYACCFYCSSEILTSEIKEWVDRGETALCPRCGIDAVIPDYTKPEDREQMKQHWFGEENHVEISVKNNKARHVTKGVDVHEESDLNMSFLQREAHENSASKGFWDEVDGQKPDIGSKLMLIVTEVAEAMEEYRTGRPLDYTYLVDGKPEGFGVELADTVIRIADLAEHAGVDLSSLIRLKMRFNATRPKMHGKRV